MTGAEKPTLETADRDAEEAASWKDLAGELYAASEHSAREEWEAHRNPLVVWEFILRRCETARLASEDKWTADGNRQPLPDWASDYLETVAWRLRELSGGRDWRRFPFNGAAGEYRAYRKNANLSPTAAAALTALSLGLTEETGRNAFAARRTAQEAASARDALALWQIAGLNRPALSPREARERVMEEYGFTDERAFRRFLAKGRGRVKPTRRD